MPKFQKQKKRSYLVELGFYGGGHHLRMLAGEPDPKKKVRPGPFDASMEYAYLEKEEFAKVVASSPSAAAKKAMTRIHKDTGWTRANFYLTTVLKPLRSPIYHTRVYSYTGAWVEDRRKVGKSGKLVGSKAHAVTQRTAGSITVPFTEKSLVVAAFRHLPIRAMGKVPNVVRQVFNGALRQIRNAAMKKDAALLQKLRWEAAKIKMYSPHWETEFEL